MTEKKCLENLLMDIDILNELRHFTNDINIFNVLKIENAELKHSIVLAYLFNPIETHGLGSKPLELLFKMLSLNNNSKLNIFNLLDIDYYDFNILREYKNIDILIKSTKNRIVISIENKIWTGEHSNQLTRYKETIDHEFPNYKKIYIYLTPKGYDASDNENWMSLSYENIIEIIDELNLDNINKKIKILIEDYKSMIRRNIMNDYELKEVCNKIYRKHKQAFDLIWEHKEDDTYYLYSIVNNYINEKVAKGLVNYDEKNSSKTYIRFTTADLENNFPLLEENISSWKNKHTVFYEIIIGRIQIRAQVAFGYKDVDRAKRYIDAANYLKELGLQPGNDKENSGYFTKIFNGVVSIDNITLEEEQDKEYISKELDKILAPIFLHTNTNDNNSVD